MEYNFDKEMDTLLRQAARSGQVVSTADFDSHLDADEISMFAENALPEKARSRAIKHLADCSNCRSILSNLISLNEETELETVSAVAEEKEIQTAAVPWYKKLFIFPQIAYAMGALALAFSGVVGFLIYQAANETGSFEMAKSSPMLAENKSVSGPNAGDGEPDFNESNSNSIMANTTIDSNSATSADSDMTQTGNANASTPSAPTATIPSDKKADESDRRNKDVSPESRPNPVLQTTPAENKRDDKPAGEVTTADDSTMSEEPPKSAPRPPVTTRSSEPKKKSEEEQAKLKGRTDATRRVEGKIFNRVNGVWIDSAYNQTALGNLTLPPTTTVRRGSSQYKNLDKSFRKIAESLEGPLIVVSNGKAYRIQ